jgi:5-methylcytosine-specific restriction endonuclease McrA
MDWIGTMPREKRTKTQAKKAAKIVARAARREQKPCLLSGVAPNDSLSRFRKPPVPCPQPIPKLKPPISQRDRQKERNARKNDSAHHINIVCAEIKRERKSAAMEKRERMIPNKSYRISTSEKIFRNRNQAITAASQLGKPFSLFKSFRGGAWKEVSAAPNLKNKKKQKRSKAKPKPKPKTGARPCLHFASYKDYLESELWKAIRDKVLKRDDGLCLVCRCRASEVHHRSYATEVLKGEKLELLMSICRPCHKAIHFDGAKKRTLGDANRLADELAQGRSKAKGQRADARTIRQTAPTTCAV